MQIGFIFLSPYFGPFFSAFIINTEKWQWAFGVFTILSGIALISQILFADETFYNRKLPRSQQPERRSRFLRLIGTEQWKSRHQRSTFKEAVMRPVKVITRPVIALICFYYVFTFAWAVGINTTLAMLVTPLYGFGPKQIGFFYFTPLVSATIGEVMGHWLHDYVANFMTRRNKGTFQPEYRLPVIWLSTPLVVTGLVVLGFSLESGWHFMVTSVAW
jgi:nitrate/nitrite transporter NarK